ncbi:MAG: bifunctional adenosylcobinamide kinase/adenosylcobinamide-phosphate guanylyltransferase [Proteobacteria bacterium]|nr:bifunctional adenosylcobinamide kinase/adenosylcobinamide-phosphate guanylyltransferase [Pseudomonadota bacterium]
MRAATTASPLPPVTLILGGARSGKSAYAERLLLGAVEPQARVLYVATAEALDTEMTARIRAHRDRRGARWQTIEEPRALAELLMRETRVERPALVDCLTLWVSNLMADGADVAAAADRLIAALPRLAGPVVFVANEVGLGIVPDNRLAREFRDHAGRLNQALAAAADCVVFVAAGLPLVLKNRP